MDVDFIVPVIAFGVMTLFLVVLIGCMMATRQ